MSQQPIRFEDGAAYERAMGVWSRSVGEVFLDWLSPAPGLRWIDVGCGNGAFTELLLQRCAPVSIQAIDPSEAQLAFARARPAAQGATFQRGDAMALPFGASQFDAAVMALVIFFVSEPARGLAEMIRVAAPGGLVCAYAWNVVGGGLPIAPIHAELRAMAIEPPLPPSADVSRLAALHALWTDAGLEAVTTREIPVARTYDDFEDFWSASLGSAGLEPLIATMAAGDAQQLKQRVRARLPPASDGRITCQARANAVQGRLPKLS